MSEGCQSSTTASERSCGLGHHLHAVVQIGKEGISEGLLAAVAEVLGQHELIKLKLLGPRRETVTSWPTSWPKSVAPRWCR